LTGTSLTLPLEQEK